jgi:hypothetical protein
VRRIVFGIFAVVLFVNGVSLLFTENCSSVSFDGQAGSRVLSVVCHPDSSGLVPAGLAAAVMIILSMCANVMVFLPTEKEMDMRSQQATQYVDGNQRVNHSITQTPVASVSADLTNLSALYEKGLLTREEFEAAKKRLLTPPSSFEA